MEKPKKRRENIINRYMLGEILVCSLYSLCVCLLFLKLPIINNIFLNNEHKKTAFFTLFIFLAIFNAFNSRTERINIFAKIMDNIPFILIIIFIFAVQVSIVYFGFNIFNTTRITLMEFCIVLFIALTIIPIDLIRKYIVKKRL